MEKSIILITFTLVLMIGSMNQMVNAGDFGTAAAISAGSMMQGMKSMKQLSQGKVRDSITSGIGSVKTGMGAMEVMMKKNEWTF